MVKQLVPDQLWMIVEPLLPPEPPKPNGGRPRVPDRAALAGIIYVLKSGIPWGMLAKGFDFGSGVTCWRRLRDWQKAGVWRRLHRVLLDELGKAGLIDWSRASLDSASVPAKKGGTGTGPNPLDRGRPGSKRHVVTDARGVPLTIALTGAHVHDSKMFEDLIDSIAPVRGKRGRPRRRPEKLHADKGYDYPRCRRFLRKRGIQARIARRGVESGERLGRHRWVVERTLAWLSRCKRLCVRYERREDIHEAFLVLCCALICLSYLRHAF
ncbi:MAG TPA: IS5 family transposase [Rubrobacteraceae bacterium]|nr:IS5 family transposase [Rubrobacteraceae bacterium]